MIRTAIKSALAVALLLVILQLAYWLGVRRYFVSVADAVAPVAALRFDGVAAFPPGQLGLDGLRFEVAGRDDLVLTADRLRARSDDLAWLGRWLLGLDSRAPDELVIRLEGVRASDALIRQLRHQSDALGVVIPFEGVACGDSATLTDDDYAALGWNNAGMNLQVDLLHDPAARRLQVAVRIDRTPAGVLHAQLDFADVPDGGIVLTAGLGGARLERMAMDYDEQGALARRNDHCATTHDQGDGNTFIAAHLKGVHDWLRAQGIVPDEPIWAAYRGWVTTGGPIRLVAEPAQGVRLQEYAQFAPEDRLRLLGISARMANGEPVPVEATAARSDSAAFRPLPPLSDIDPLEAFHPAEPVDTPVFPLSDVVVEASVDSVDTNAAVVGDTGSPASPGGTARSSRTPPRPTTVYEVMSFPELALSLGQRVRIDTVNGNQHRGVVLDATADAVELEIRRYGGGARLPIARDQISRIERARDTY